MVALEKDNSLRKNVEFITKINTLWRLLNKTNTGMNQPSDFENDKFFCQGFSFWNTLKIVFVPKKQLNLNKTSH